MAYILFIKITHSSQVTMNDIARMEVMKALRDFKKLEYGVGDKQNQ
jgi:hypothetical protein